MTGLISLDDAKKSLGITTTTNDEDIQRYIDAATPVIEQKTGPLTPGTVTYKIDGGGYALSLPVKFNSVTTLKENGTTITDFVSDGGAGLIFGGTTTVPREFKSGTRNMEATVTVGAATIPPNVQLAARELVRHWWQLGRQGPRPQFENGSMVVANGFGVPTKRVMEILDPSYGLEGFA